MCELSVAPPFNIVSPQNRCNIVGSKQKMMPNNIDSKKNCCCKYYTTSENMGLIEPNVVLHITTNFTRSDVVFCIFLLLTSLTSHTSHTFPHPLCDA